MGNIRILAFAGSARGQSYNRMMLAFAAGIAREMGCDVELAELRDFPMPLYDGDDERANGQPRAAKDLKKRLLRADALLLACPEYNASITPLLKNTIDWMSRPQPGEPNAFKMKPTALLSASLGALGGLRGLTTVRAVLTQLGALVAPTQFALAGASTAFDEDGRLISAAQRQLLEDTLAELVSIGGAMRLARSSAPPLKASA
jgi:NAD(P)H-dependent FMN reductase